MKLRAFTGQNVIVSLWSSTPDHPPECCFEIVCRRQAGYWPVSMVRGCFTIQFCITEGQAREHAIQRAYPPPHGVHHDGVKILALATAALKIHIFPRDQPGKKKKKG
jgi:hypothetical protein